MNRFLAKYQSKSNKELENIANDSENYLENARQAAAQILLERQEKQVEKERGNAGKLVLSHEGEELVFAPEELRLIGEVWYHTDYPDSRSIFLYLKETNYEISTELPAFEAFWAELEDAFGESIPREITTAQNWHQVLWPKEIAGSTYFQLTKVKSKGLIDRLLNEDEHEVCDIHPDVLRYLEGKPKIQ
ncbi:hypothetical protein KFE98_05440 [bacterium SCSIO 12741]|nr:hypothetical protein KFE98_05440 [bacterium SCSIO 12741]